MEGHSGDAGGQSRLREAAGSEVTECPELTSLPAVSAPDGENVPDRSVPDRRDRQPLLLGET